VLGAGQPESVGADGGGGAVVGADVGDDVGADVGDDVGADVGADVGGAVGGAGAGPIAKGFVSVLVNSPPSITTAPLTLNL